jgi:hypothetical protein
LEEPTESVMRAATLAVRITGVVSLVCSLYGLYRSISVLVSGRVGDELVALADQFQYFYLLLYSMIGVNLICFFILGWCGLEQLRLRLTHLKFFIGVFLFELLFALFVGRILFHDPKIGNTIAAVAGITLPWLLLPFFILLPFWGSILLLWAKKRL